MTELMPTDNLMASSQVLRKREAEKQNVPWTSLPLETLQKMSPAFDADFAGSLSLEAALASKKVPGGTAPECVRAAISDLPDRIAKLSSRPGAKP